MAIRLICLVMFFAFSHLDAQCVPSQKELSNSIQTLYRTPELRNNIDYTVLRKAMTGYYALKNNGMLKNDKVLTIIDYNQPSVKKRLFVIDMDRNRLLASSLVAHGKNSGQNHAVKFSNVPGSFKSSLGFFVTDRTYEGKHGYSLRLQGIERGINDNALMRNIVMHGADYVSPDFIRRHGRLGRSHGCPALPFSQYRQVIDLIKGGSCLFIYHGDQNYAGPSNLLNPRISLHNPA
ncbi:MAG: murein L,D-transpeptidase catalytic domain family protein [Chlorobiales bacterium]|nr:murein L,D-transpeptidase catalytic domain family protein [Chlorobiales bacterium]